MHRKPEQDISTPTVDQVTRALDVTTHPEHFYKSPAILGGAWATLKAQRGQPVDFANTGEPAYVIKPAEAPSAADSVETITRRAQAKARQYIADRHLNGGDAA